MSSVTSKIIGIHHRTSNTLGVWNFLKNVFLSSTKSFAFVLSLNRLEGVNHDINWSKHSLHYMFWVE